MVPGLWFCQYFSDWWTQFVHRYTLTLILKPPSKSNTSSKPSCIASHRAILPKWRCISVRVEKVVLIAFQKTNCVCRFYRKLLSYSATVWPLIFKTITFTDVICVLILSLKLPQGSNTKASNLTSLRIVLPTMAKWRCISLRVWKVLWAAFPENELCI